MMYKSAVGRWLMFNRNVFPKIIHGLLYLTSLVFIIVLFSSILSLLEPAIPNHCIEFQDHSRYEPVPVVVTSVDEARRDTDYDFNTFASLLAFDEQRLSKYRLLRVIPSNVNPTGQDVADTLPVLFAHGHRGGFSQANAVATLLNAEYHAIKQNIHSHILNKRQRANDWAVHHGALDPTFGTVRLFRADESADGMQAAGSGSGANSTNSHANPHDSALLSAYTTYSIDFLEESSAFSPDIVKAQAYFAAACVSALRGLHPRAKRILIIGHSMGGLVLQLAPLMPNFVPGSVDTLFALSSPIQQHPFLMDAKYTHIYDTLRAVWNDGLCPWMQQGVPHPGCPATDDIVVVSVHGGASDITIRPDLSFVGGRMSHKRAVTVSTMSIPGAWLTCDHEGIVNCGQVISVLAENIFIAQLADRQPGAGAAEERLAAWAAALTPRLPTFTPIEPSASGAGLVTALPSTAKTQQLCTATSLSQKMLIVSRVPLQVAANFGDPSITLSDGFPAVDTRLHNHLHARWDMARDVDAWVGAALLTGLRWTACAVSAFAAKSSCNMAKIFPSARLQSLRLSHESQRSAHKHDHPPLAADVVSQENSLWLYTVDVATQGISSKLCLQPAQDETAWRSALLDMRNATASELDGWLVGMGGAAAMTCEHSPRRSVCQLPINASIAWRHQMQLDISPYLEYRIVVQRSGPSSFDPLLHFSSCGVALQEECESFFLRPLQINSIMDGNVFIYSFSVHTLLVPTLKPTITMVADANQEYSFEIEAMGDIALSQWLHHHGLWALCAVVAFAIFTFGVQIAHYSSAKGVDFPSISRSITQYFMSYLLFASLIGISPLILQAIFSGNGEYEALSGKRMSVSDSVVANFLAFGMAATFAWLSDLLTGCYDCNRTPCLRPKPTAQNNSKAGLHRQVIPIPETPPASPSLKQSTSGSISLRRKAASQAELLSDVKADPGTPEAVLRASTPTHSAADSWFDRRKRKSSSWDELELSVTPPALHLTLSALSVKYVGGVLLAATLMSVTAPWPALSAVCITLLCRIVVASLCRALNLRTQICQDDYLSNVQLITLAGAGLMILVRFMTIVHCFEELFRGNFCLTEFYFVFPLIVQCMFSLVAAPVIPITSREYLSCPHHTRLYLRKCGAVLKILAGVCYSLCVFHSVLLPFCIILMSVIICTCYMLCFHALSLSNRAVDTVSIVSSDMIV